MDSSILLFVDCLRRHGVRVSTAEAVDAMRCAAVPGMLAGRERLHAALRAAIVTRASDVETFDSVFALFFALQPIPTVVVPGTDGTIAQDLPPDGTPGDGADDLEDFSLVDATSGTTPISSSPSAEADMSEYFDPESLSEGYNLDDDADIVNLASMTDEISFSPSGGKANARGMKVQLDVSKTQGANAGSLTPATGQALDLELSDDEEHTLLNWLGAASTSADAPDDADVAGLLDKLPEYLSEHLRRLAGLRRTTIAPEVSHPVVLDEVSEAERERFEESLRRLARTLHGGLAQKHRVSPRGRVDPARTTRRSLRYDGVPFRPVTTRRVPEKSRVMLLTDVSLSVRATARFTLHMVHSMHQTFGHARTFAFVDELTEITGLFDRHPLEHALGLVFGGAVLDTDASSDYGRVFTQLLEDNGNALDRRTSLIILGDGRSNGKDPALDVVQEIARRVRRIVWLTPEPSYSWGLGACALPAYAQFCERVDVVSDLSALERTAEKMAVTPR